MTEPIASLPAAVATQGALPMPAGPVREVDVPLDDRAAEAQRIWAERERRVAALHFEQAADRATDPSEQIAYRLDAWLVKHPDDVRAAAAAYPDWPAQFAAIKAAHSAPQETSR